MRLSLLALLLVLSYRAQASENCTAEQSLRVRVGAQTFNVDVAISPQERERGLSGRKSLTAGSGLWFVFPWPEQYGFWMRDMHFPLDLVWVGPTRQVLGAVTLPPCADEPCHIYHPPGPVAYVLEINAGEFAGKAGDDVTWSCTP